MIDLDDIVDWLRRRKHSFVNARRVAKVFKISPKMAGYLLRRLKEEGYLKIHRKRRGRFIVYKVNKSLIHGRKAAERIIKKTSTKKVSVYRGKTSSGMRSGTGKSMTIGKK